MSRVTIERRAHDQIVKAINVVEFNARVFAYIFHQDSSYLHERFFEMMVAVIRAEALSYDQGNITNVTTNCKRLCDTLDKYGIA